MKKEFVITIQKKKGVPSLTEEQIDKLTVDEALDFFDIHAQVKKIFFSDKKRRVRTR